MKNIFCKIAFLALAFVAVIAAAAAPAYAGEIVRVVPENPWYRGIDVTTGELVDPPFFGQNTVQDFLHIGTLSILTLHPEFYPEPDEPNTSVVSTAIEEMEVWYPNEGEYRPCLSGTQAINPSECVLETEGPIYNEKYFNFRVTFHMYAERTGATISYFTWSDLYFKIPDISVPSDPEEAPEEEEFEGGIGY